MPRRTFYRSYSFADIWRSIKTGRYGEIFLKAVKAIIIMPG